MDPDHDLICELYPWFTPVMEDNVRDNYYDIVCGDPDPLAKKNFNSFWEGVPKHVWPIPAEVQYMWEDYCLIYDEPWIASTLPAGLYDDIIATMNMMVPVEVTISECNAKSFVGFCKIIYGKCYIRVSSQYTGVRYFLTLTHEIAHLLAWMRYSTNIKPHGKEWKDEYRSFVLRFMSKGYFTTAIEHAIIIHMANPPYCAKLHTELMKVLNPGYVPVKELRRGKTFRLSDNHVYVKTQQKYSTVYFKCLQSDEEFMCHKDTMVVRVF
jgi:hypothetical protein